MKQISCYDCEKVFESETSEDILNQFYAHYMKEHIEIIKGASEEEKNAWMKKFNRDWETAEEI